MSEELFDRVQAIQALNGQVQAELEALADLPKHFVTDGDVVMSHVIASLSSVFPDGEDFFVRSVRHYRDRITDPELKRQVAGFIGQEATHGREHRVFNNRLEELGYPAKEGEWITRKMLGLRTRLAPPSSNRRATSIACGSWM